jgi:hypothetical protein
MRRLLLVLAACGNDRAPLADVDASLIDAPPPGTPIVMVTAPRAGEAFYMTQTVQVQWVAEDDGPTMSCDVSASAGGSPIAIGTVAATSGQLASAQWSLTSVTPSPSYQVQVSCSDTTSLVGAGLSGTFAVTDPPQQVSFASQLQPIFARCTSAACHDASFPQASLNLTPGNAYAALVGIASEECPATQLVSPSAPTDSYLVHKLQGSGPCFVGSKMPKPPSTISTAEIQLVRDWIANGAPNN